MEVSIVNDQVGMDAVKSKHNRWEVIAHTGLSMYLFVNFTNAKLISLNQVSIINY